MRRPVAYAPSALTTGNMFLGFLSIVSSFNEQYILAAWLIVIGGILDVFDGKVARLSKSQSQFGGELDSLADLITFGVAPVMLMYPVVLSQYGKIGLVVGFFFMMAGAFRLARFNLLPPKAEKTNFTGMPIPTAAGTVSSFLLFTNAINGEPAFDMPLLIVGMMVITSILMMSTIEYACFPRFSFKTRKDTIKTGFLIVYFTCLAVYPAYIFFPTGFLYILSGLVGAVIGFFHDDVEDEEVSEVKV